MVKKNFTQYFRSFLVVMLSLYIVKGYGQIFSVAGGGTLPSGWTSTNNVTTQLVDQTSYYLLEAGSSSDLILSSAYNLQNYATVTLTAEVATYGTGTSNPLKVEVSTNGGTSFTQTYTSATPSSSSPYISSGSIVLTSVSNNVVFRFSNNATSGRGVRLRNIVLNGTLPPSIAISNGSIAAANVTTGSTNVVLQRYDFGVTSANASLTGLTVTTAGTYAASDISNLKVRYSADATLDAGDATLSTKSTSLGAGSHIFPSFTAQSISTGTTGYVFVTADIAAAATPGNTINIGTTNFTAITFASGSKTGTDPVAAGGVQTIVAAPVPVVTGATLSGTVATSFSASVSATNTPTSYAVASGSLPTGLTLNTTTGAITGTPTAAGSFTADITAANASGTSTAATFTFNIAKANQTITFGALATQTYGAAPLTLNATTTASGLTVSYSSSNTNVATISGNTLTIVGVGTSTITASQAGDANYNAATNVAVTLTVNAKGLTITGLSGVSRAYDRTTTATLSGTPTLSGVVAGDEANVSLSGTPSATFATSTVGTNKAITVTGYTLSGSSAGNYTLTQPTGLTANITAATLTVTGVVVADKVYNGNTTATVTTLGTLNGVVAGDEAAVAISSTATFAQAGAGNNIAVTLSLTGSAAGNYSLTQPGVTANITKANQTITFGALANRASNAANFSLTATANSGLTVSYVSSNTAVATISGSTVTIVGVGTTTITASQAGDANYNAATSVDQTLTVVPPTATTDYFRSAATGSFFTASTWESSADNVSWITASLTPTSASTAINIRSGHIVTASGTNVSIDDATVESGGTLTISSDTVTIANGAATVDLLVNGTLTLSGGAITTTGAVSFGSTGVYNHSRNSGTIPTATWDVNSTCNVTGVTNTAPAGLGQSFGKFTWNCTGQTTFIAVGNTAFNPKGLFTLVSTNGRNFQLEASASGAKTYNLDGGLSITGGIFMLNFDNTSSASVVTLNITGNLSISGSGKLNFFGGSGSVPSTLYGSIINLTGNLSLSSNLAIDRSSNKNFGQINFTGTTQSYTRTVSPASQYVDYVIKAGSTLTLNNNFQLRSTSLEGDYDQLEVYGTLNMGTSVVNSSSGTQTRLFVYTGASIVTSNTNGINSALAANIRTIQAGVNYTLNGATTTPFPTSAQLSTWGNPANVTLGANVSLNRDVVMTGTLDLTDKILTLNGYALTTSGLTSTTGSLSGDDVATLTIAGTSGSVGTARFAAGGRTLGKLTMNRSGQTLTLGSDLVLDASFANTATDHALVLTAGVVDAGANTLTFLNGAAGNLPISRTSGTLTVGSSTALVFGGAGKTGGVAFTLPNSVFTSAPNISSLTLNRTNGLSLSNQSLTTQALTLTLGTLDLQGNSVSVSTLTRTSGALNASATGAAVNINTAAPLTLSAGLFTGNVQSLSLSGGGSITLGANQTIVNALSLGTNTLDLNGFVLTVQGSAVATSGTINASAIGSEIVFANASPLVLPTNLFTGNVNSLTVNGAGGITLGQNITVNTALTLTTGNISLGAYTLTVPATATLTGGSASSFVVTNGEGFLNRRITTTPTVFPIGYAVNAYRPMTMAITSGQADYNARAFQNSITGTGNFVTQQWHIQRTAQDQNPVNMTFNWAAADESASLGNTVYGYLSTNAGVSFAQLASTGTKTGTDPFSTTLEVPSTDNGLIVLSDVAANGVLPVSLVSFTGREVGTANILRWETASEEKMAYFEVERRDGQSAAWRVLGRVKAYNQAAVYTLSDATPLSMGYYRLKMVDLDGTMRYSKTIAIARMATTAHDLEVFPNPTSYEVSVRTQLSQEGLVTYRLIDLAGRVHYSTQVQMVAGEQMTTLDVAHLPAGTYILEVQSVSKTERARIIKQ